MSIRTTLVSFTVATVATVATLAAVVTTGCATDTETPEHQGSTISEQKFDGNSADPSKSCCAICWNRSRGVDVGGFLQLQFDGVTCNARANELCDAPGEGRGGLYDAEWGNTGGCVDSGDSEDPFEFCFVQVGDTPP